MAQPDFAWIYVFVSFFVGCFVAFSELATRYNDSPRLFFKNYASWVYIFINGSASTLVYLLSMFADVKVFGKTVNDSPLLMSFLMGISAMGLLRSSFFNLKYNNKHVDIGAHKTIQMLLDWVDRMYDRHRSENLIVDVYPVMRGIAFSEAKCDIMLTCIAAMDGISKPESDDLNKIAHDLNENPDINDQTKSIQLGLKIAKVTGIDLLSKVADRIKLNSEQVSLVGSADKIQQIKEFKQILLRSDRGDCEKT